MKKAILECILLAIVTFVLPGMITYIIMRINGTSTVYNMQKIPDVKWVIVEYENGKIKMSVEDYLVYVLGELYEENDPPEYLKCRCVMARTLLCNTMCEDNTIDCKSVNLSFLTQKQFVEKYGEDYISKQEMFENIVAETGEDKIYYKDKLIEPIYHFLSAGTTKDGQSIQKCLRSVECPEDIKASEYEVTKVFENTFLEEKLGSSDITVLSREKSGYVEALRVGEKVLTGETVAMILELNSSCMYIKKTNAGLEITTKGLGNGYGLSVNSAKCMALAGSSYQDILARFYKNIKIKK